MSKLERKVKYNEAKQTLKQIWAAATETSSGDEGVEVPSHYKKYTIQDRHILLQTPERQRTQPGTSYDGPENTKRIDLARPREEAKPVYIASDLTPEEEQELIALLMEYREVFAWSYKDLKRGDPSICQHTIPMKVDVKPSRQRPYTYNKTFAKTIKEEIEKLKEAEFIYGIEHIEWVSPIVVVSKKIGKLKSLCQSQKSKCSYHMRQLSSSYC